MSTYSDTTGDFAIVTVGMANGMQRFPWDCKGGLKSGFA